MSESVGIVGLGAGNGVGKHVFGVGNGVGKITQLSDNQRSVQEIRDFFIFYSIPLFLYC